MMFLRSGTHCGPRLDSMEDFSKAKIWKYMDLAKFASLLTTQSLYFACPTEFNDPYEGLLPKNHNEAISNMLQKHLDDVMTLKKPFATRGISANVIDDAPIEKGHQHNLLFIKRKSFEHEKEVRATLLLPEAGKGIPIPCDLDVLVTRVHVSP